MIPTLRLKPERDKSLLRRHPWVFSGSVAEVNGAPQSGVTIQIVDHSGQFLAWGAYSPQSQISARVWSWEAGEQIGPAFFRRRLQRALARRQGLLEAGCRNAWRWVHGESDGLPGLVVDRYADSLVVQLLSAGPEAWCEVLVDELMAVATEASLPVTRLYERSDVDVRRLEGLPLRSGLLRGAPLAGPLQIEENGLQFQVDLAGGHKTGYYLDQRHNRARVGHLARGRQVLDCFTYTGGFTCHALAGGAETILAVDASAEALDLARQNVAGNHLELERVEWQAGDVFQVLRRLRDSRRQFDLIVLDPPKFAQTAAQAERAARGYKDINLLAFKLLRPGGLLATFSCSGGVSDDLFQKIVAGAALDAGVEAVILEHLHQAADHPVALNFPEGSYLKGLILQV